MQRLWPILSIDTRNKIGTIEIGSRDSNIRLESLERVMYLYRKVENQKLKNIIET